MPLYCGIDLHSNNSYLVILDDEDRVVLDKRVSNQLEEILGELEPFRNSLSSIAVESTYNWYWLADGLEDHGYPLQLVNPVAAQQYKGLKHRDDASDARWIAHMMRNRLLPTGHIMQRDDRAIRDLLRQRGRVVQQKTRNLLQLKSKIANHTGITMKAAELKKLEVDQIAVLVESDYTLRSMQSSIDIIKILETEVADLQAQALKAARPKPGYRVLRTIKGVGELLAMVILFETGSIQRFKRVGNYASYCRCVGSEYQSNGKKKGSGNRKNGNKYLSWAFAEAAHFAIRFQPSVRRYYDRKKNKTNARVAASTVAHKLSRAVYFMLRDEVDYKPDLLFGAPS